MLSASHTTTAQKTRLGVGFQEWHANIRLSADHLEATSLGDPTVVITLAALGTSLVTPYTRFAWGLLSPTPLLLGLQQDEKQ